MERTPDTPPWGGRWRPLLIGLEGVFVLGPSVWLASLSYPFGTKVLNSFWHWPDRWQDWILGLSWWLGVVTLFCGAAVYLRLMRGAWVPAWQLFLFAVMGAVATVGLMVGLTVGSAGFPAWILLLLMPLLAPVLLFALRAVTAREVERG